MTIYPKSVHSFIFNATMISRYVGKTFKKLNSPKNVQDFKISTFRELEKLTGKMDMAKLTETDILDSIRSLSGEFGISFGQAQKPINVILKYHFYLTRSEDARMKEVLHCPIDSVVLKRLSEELGLKPYRSLRLTNINEKKYLEIQNRIQQQSKTRIEYDKVFDIKHLQDEGIL